MIRATFDWSPVQNPHGGEDKTFRQSNTIHDSRAFMSASFIKCSKAFYKGENMCEHTWELKVRTNTSKISTCTFCKAKKYQDITRAEEMMDTN